jgi:hypothetical protein
MPTSTDAASVEDSACSCGLAHLISPNTTQTNIASVSGRMLQNTLYLRLQLLPEPGMQRQNVPPGLLPGPETARFGS